MVGGADVVIDAEPSGSFNSRLKLQPCRADAPNIEHDLESPTCLLGAVDGACEDGNVGVVCLIIGVPRAVATNDDSLHLFILTQHRPAGSRSLRAIPDSIVQSAS
jgi:hypothetical protein